ncbi:MAG: hypothetical protein IJ661_03440 [Lachnospiraceae bacterium]|nr:hypothetical protein [Lachnospiraceae bacterium]
MAEKLAEVFEQYDMEIISTRKGRGSTIITTGDGMRILEPFRGSMVRLEQEYVLKQLFAEKGLNSLDSIIPNKDGQLFSCDRYRQPYVLKTHFEGEECDMRNPSNVTEAVKALSEFHVKGKWVAGQFEARWSETRREKEEQRVEEIKRVLEDGEELERIAYLYEISQSALQKAINEEIKQKKEINDNVNGGTHMDESYVEDVKAKFVRHNAQIRKIGRFVSKVKRRNEFENLFLEVFGDFYKQGAACVDMLEKGLEEAASESSKQAGETVEAGSEGSKQADVAVEAKDAASAKRFEERVLARHYGICHGSFNQHNVIIGENDIAIVHFERFSRGNQLNDLYQFSRKVMEKNNYDFELLQNIFEAYEANIELSKDDYTYLYILFSYPEKFWKIANSYYNSSKAFLSPKYIEKLQTLILQEKEKKEMLGRLKGIVIEGI